MLWHCQYAQQVGIDKKTIISSMFPGGIILIIKKESLCIYKDIYQKKNSKIPTKDQNSWWLYISSLLYMLSENNRVNIFKMLSVRYHKYCDYQKDRTSLHEKNIWADKK